MSTETAAFQLGAGKHSKPIEDACIKYGIDTELRKSHFLGQMAVESQGFTCTSENLNYATGALLSLFGRHRITNRQAEQYGRNQHHSADQPQLANILYGGAWGRKNLGNTEPGDGWHFRGRGLKQVTGRDNYRRCSQELFGDDTLLHTPELLEQEPWASLSAGWFWMAKGLNAIADTDDVGAVTKVVNGGYNGLDDRKMWTARAKAEFRKLRNPDEQ